MMSRALFFPKADNAPTSFSSLFLSDTEATKKRFRPLKISVRANDFYVDS